MTPSRSSAMTCVSAEMPGSAIALVLGRPGNTGQVLAAGAAAALLATTADNRGDLDRAADDQRTDPGRAAELVGRQADEIGADRGSIDRDLAGRLNRIAMEQSTVAMGNGRDFGDRLDRAGFVVRKHHRNQSRAGIGREQLFEPPKIENT